MHDLIVPWNDCFAGDRRIVVFRVLDWKHVSFAAIRLCSETRRPAAALTSLPGWHARLFRIVVQSEGRADVGPQRLDQGERRGPFVEDLLRERETIDGISIGEAREA